MDDFSTLLTLVGERIREQRGNLGLTQEELAEKASLNTSYVGQIERGLREPSLRVLHKLSHALNLTLSELLVKDMPEGEMMRGEVMRLLSEWSPEQQQAIFTMLQELKKLRPS